jgi:hypothetical protein
VMSAAFSNSCQSISLAMRSSFSTDSRPSAEPYRTGDRSSGRPRCRPIR